MLGIVPGSKIRVAVLTVEAWEVYCSDRRDLFGIITATAESAQYALLGIATSRSHCTDKLMLNSVPVTEMGTGGALQMR